ncbi:nitrate reductase [Solimonas terrae]|uniref:Molybdopterin-dependent oxidoreductase n=1 Tax=Solimonas terrae TaxID=1396819 RepID=A0A6M2BKQ9_9GAMM|nr:nitrate reductase [Solimonas terrae]NGY03402.1 molybdopterin-dependent oxidoreductase [Solimonas terrae]
MSAASLQSVAAAGGLATTCPYCGVGCGVRVDTRKLTVSGDVQHPANGGRLCVKGSALGETLGLDGRLLRPQRRVAESGPERWQALAWDDALSEIATRFARTIARHGPESVAFYVSGQLLTEDYYVANKLMKGYLGSANIDTNSRLCMSSAVAGHKRAFGEDLVPGCYEDFELADLVVLVGSNTAWCHPVLYQRIVAEKERRPELRVVVVDPRRTPTCDIADLHLPLAPGSDVPLFNGLLAWLATHGAADRDFIAAHTRDADAALAAAAETAGDLDALAVSCGLQRDRLETFFNLFAATDKVVTLFSQGVNQSGQGTDKVNAIINCHLYTGRIGKPGMGPFSMTGQPNAMGGREVGGLSNTLAAHLELGDPRQRALVQRFWNSPTVAETPGPKAVDLFEAVHDGRIKALWIMATNPVVSLPDADRVREALRRCDFVVVSDVVASTDTAQLAHLLLPALSWGEKDGTVTNSERVISRQRAFRAAPGEARPDWWALAEVGRRLGHEQAFDYAGPQQIFDEHARLSAFENGGERVFNLAGLAGMSDSEYDALAPIRWPVPAPGIGSERLFGDGRFPTEDGRAMFVPVTPVAPAHPLSEQFPFILNTGRIRDQWHTMTRTGVAPTLGAHLPEPYVDLHAADVLACGLREGGLARVTSRWGTLVARVRCSGEMRRGQVFVPIHWNDQFASDARVGALVNPVVDPVSGEPEFKHTPVRVDEFRAEWQGVLYARGEVDLQPFAWWAKVQAPDVQRYEFSGRGKLDDRSAWARSVLRLGVSAGDWIEYRDDASGIYHAAHFRDGRLQACLYVAPPDLLPARGWLAELFGRARLTERDRVGLLAGAPLGPVQDSGPLVCSCFRVGRNTIVQAIRERDLKSPKDVTACLRAGGNCGSCLPEIRGLLAECALVEAAP